MPDTLIDKYVAFKIISFRALETSEVGAKIMYENFNMCWTILSSAKMTNNYVTDGQYFITIFECRISFLTTKKY